MALGTEYGVKDCERMIADPCSYWTTTLDERYPKMKLEIVKRMELDTDPDMSYLGSFGRTYQPGAIAHGHRYCQNCQGAIECVPANGDGTGAVWVHGDPQECDMAVPVPERHTMEWFYPTTEYGAQDYARMLSYNNDRLSVVGIIIEATLTDDDGFSRTFDTSLWGIEYTDSSYLDDVARDLWQDIRDEVGAHYTGEGDVDALFDESEFEDS